MKKKSLFGNTTIGGGSDVINKPSSSGSGGSSGGVVVGKLTANNLDTLDQIMNNPNHIIPSSTTIDMKKKDDTVRSVASGTAASGGGGRGSGKGNKTKAKSAKELRKERALKDKKALLAATPGKLQW